MEIRDVFDTLEGFRDGIQKARKNGRKVSVSTFFALDTIIDALGKQMPKEPVLVWNEETDHEYWGCPGCSMAIHKSMAIPKLINFSGNDTDDGNDEIPIGYCPVCGQRLDWSSL